MNTDPAKLAASSIRWSHYLVGIVLLVATLVLVGWIADIEVFKRIFPGVVAMNPLTAILFLLLGGAFFLLASPRATSQAVGSFLLVLVVLAAGVKLIELGLGVPRGVDTWFFSSEIEVDHQGVISNRMAVNTALCYLLTSAALWLAHRPYRWAQRVATYLTLTSFFFALLSFIGYLYVVDVFYAILAHVPMAFHTAINFLLLSAALLFAYPQRGIMAEFISSRTGGVVARRILPSIFLIPMLLGGIILVGEWQNLFGLDFGLAFFCLGSIFMFLIVNWKLIKLLNYLDLTREEVETALRKTNRDLAMQTTELESSNEELEAFSYSVSHDLRAPLRAVGGYAQVLHEDYEAQLDESGKKSLNLIIRNAEKMGRLIDDLLRFSKVGRANLQREPLDMVALAKATYKELTQVETSAVAMDIAPMPNAYADYTLIALLYQNLIANAIKYSSKKPDPHIWVGVEKQAGETVYFVKDNGSGFDMRHYDKLFGVFHRLHKQSEFEGTGVGLAIAQKIVHAHGGKIWAEGVVDAGATFYFTLDNLSPP